MSQLRSISPLVTGPSMIRGTRLYPWRNRIAKVVLAVWLFRAMEVQHMNSTRATRAIVR